MEWASSTFSFKSSTVWRPHCKCSVVRTSASKVWRGGATDAAEGASEIGLCVLACPDQLTNLVNASTVDLTCPRDSGALSRQKSVASGFVLRQGSLICLQLYGSMTALGHTPP